MKLIKRVPMWQKLLENTLLWGCKALIFVLITHHDSIASNGVNFASMWVQRMRVLLANKCMFILGHTSFKFFSKLLTN